jgi:hypothetical protein
MRTLSRPMFNMGGPIKQGIMHGIREPYRGGQLVRPGPGRPGYAGEAQAINAARWLATIGSRGTQAGGAANVFSNVGRTIGGVGSKISAATPGWLKSWIGRDPTAKGLGWGYKTGLLTAGYIGSKFLPDGTPKDVVTDVMKPGGYPGADKKIKKAQDAFAEAQKDTRVKKYLDMMGYDRSKKTAVADALIDASKIVSDRGTLETKNITRDLINPIIQATSKRFDKPEQIREAVGLMSVKAAITKDLEDPQVKKLRALQITDAEQKIAESASFEGGLSKFISDRKGKVDKVTLERIARLLANEHKEPFTLVEEDTDVTNLDNGIYMSGGKIIRVTEGVPQQIV